MKKYRHRANHKQAKSPKATRSSLVRQSGGAVNAALVLEDAAHYPVPYEENLLERARTQWEFGDWDSLARLERDALQRHPERAKLALLAAAGRLQTQRADEARQFLRLAQEWGISKQLLTQILAAGVHNSLGRAAALAGEQALAQQHFESAISIGSPGADTRLLMQARIGEQFLQLGLTCGTAVPISDSPIPAAQNLAIETWDSNCVQGTFEIPLYMNGSEKTCPFNTERNDLICKTADGIDFKLSEAQPLYFVSSGDGGFTKATKTPFSPIIGYEYKIEGVIQGRFEQQPIFWVFQYADGVRAISKNTSTNEGYFSLRFVIEPGVRAVAFGIRLSGTGSIKPGESWLKLTSSPVSIEDAGKEWIQEVCKNEFDTQKFSRFNERPVEYAFVFRVVSEYYPKEILDVGTGATALPYMLRNCGALITAIDNVRDYWTSGLINRHWHVIDDDIKHTKLDNKYDLITCVSVLEHIADHGAAVKAMSDLIEPGGLMIISCPYSEANYIENVYKLPGSSYGHNAPYITQSFSRAQVIEWCADCSLELLEQEYWDYWTGQYWTVGDQIIPPLRSSADKKHHISCMLFRKKGP